MKHTTIGFLAAALVFVGSAAPVRAAALTDSQVQAIVALLSSFGADASVISNVQTALSGGTPATGPSCYTFSYNLSLGATGPAVTALQSALGNDGEQVTVSGTFDDQTASAVTGFQQKYASDILAPVGLRYGTGYVGASTRAKLNQLCSSGGQQSTQTAPPTVTSAPSISGVTVNNGTVMIYGTHFDLAGNQVVVDGTNAINSLKGDASEMSFVGSAYGLTAGTHTIQVMNAQYGNSNVQSFVYSPESTQQTSSVLAISSISPTQVTSDGTITISGTDFTSGGNPTIEFYQNGSIVGMITSIAMNSISSNQIVAKLSSTIAPVSNYGLILAAGNYQVDVWNPDGTRSNKIPLSIVVAPPPTASMSASPTTINAGQSSTITFSSTSAATCSGSGITTGATSGTVTVSPTQTTTYSMTCFERASMTDSGRYAVASVTVTVNTPDPVINSFSVDTGERFSLAAQNFSTISFKADCGTLVHETIASDGVTVNYPTGSASICNAYQFYQKSSVNAANPPAITDEPLYLWNTQGVLDGSRSYVADPPGTNYSATGTLYVQVCNTAGKCATQSAPFQFLAKG